ncbi:DUF4124 domain-containing protein [Pseudoxanthomonas sp. UTMC 1351]|uniref:DUF4124 domain-containing protein n=1 Tax=Pseudoxanthomonas sp. UTMC 1351 TaxID=2695853 RepID=UPI0034CD553B
MRNRLLLLLSLLLAPGAVSAEEVVIYRCTDAAGALTVQNMPCPKGQKQEKKAMQGITTVPMAPATTRTLMPAPPAPSPAPTPAATLAAPMSAEPTADASTKIDDAKRLPPPVLFQCTTHDNDSYLTEDSVAQSRCKTLRTVGLDGNPQTGAGQACEVVQDRCARVPDGALCDAWKKRRDETEVAWRFARPENIDKNKADFDRVARIVNETCSAGSR